MTRPLHPQTQTQRGGAGDVSEEERARGFEVRDAPPLKVLGGMAAVLALMLIGLAFVAGLLLILHGRVDRPPAPFAGKQVAPPPPHLLPDPPAERRLLEARAKARLPDAAMTRGMQAVARSGWGEAAPAPPPEQAARGHVGAAR